MVFFSQRESLPPLHFSNFPEYFVWHPYSEAQYISKGSYSTPQHFLKEPSSFLGGKGGGKKMGQPWVKILGCPRKLVNG